MVLERSKCEFIIFKTKFLSIIIGRDYIKINLNKIERIAK